MAEDFNDGGSAFPQHIVTSASGQLHVSYDFADGAGMTLRDYFAGQALAGFNGQGLNAQRPRRRAGPRQRVLQIG